MRSGRKTQPLRVAPVPDSQVFQAKLDRFYGMANHCVWLASLPFAYLSMCSGVISMNASRRDESGLKRPLPAVGNRHNHHEHSEQKMVAASDHREHMS